MLNIDQLRAETPACAHKIHLNNAVTPVPTNSGLVQPVEAIGKICRNLGVWYLVDACQSAGQMDLNVEQIGCDFLTATMRKYLRGPRGASFLFASNRALDAGLELLLQFLKTLNYVKVIQPSSNSISLPSEKKPSQQTINLPFCNSCYKNSQNLFSRI
jgi:selenocysteine lyase/cysteine desulfurase